MYLGALFVIISHQVAPGLAPLPGSRTLSRLLSLRGKLMMWMQLTVVLMCYGLMHVMAKLTWRL